MKSEFIYKRINTYTDVNLVNFLNVYYGVYI